MNEMIGKLNEMRQKAYTPYYNFSVGAVLITKSGKMYTGCNIDNVTQGPGLCAERVAMSKAMSDGETEFDCIYIMGGVKDSEAINITPCGVCRQFMIEFCDKDFKIINVYENATKEYLLGELFPESFKIK